MLHTLSSLSQNQLMVTLWLAVCTSVALVTVAVMVAQRIDRAITRRRFINARLAAVMGGRS